MGDMGDTFRAMNDAGKEKREKNRSTSLQILAEKNIEFESKNCGAHLIVAGVDCLIDFWPSTGKFITRNGKKGRGVFNLIKLCGVDGNANN